MTLCCGIALHSLSISIDMILSGQTDEASVEYGILLGYIVRRFVNSVLSLISDIT